MRHHGPLMHGPDSGRVTGKPSVTSGPGQVTGKKRTAREPLWKWMDPRLPDSFSRSSDFLRSGDELHRTRDRRTGARRRVDRSRSLPEGNLRLQRSPYARPNPLEQLSRAVWSLVAACSQRPAILLTGDRGRFTENKGDRAKILRSDPSRNSCEVSTSCSRGCKRHSRLPEMLPGAIVPGSRSNEEGTELLLIC